MSAKDPANDSAPTSDWWADLHLHAFVSLTIADRKVERRERVWVKGFFVRHRRPQYFDEFQRLVDASDAYAPADIKALTAVARERMGEADKRGFVNNLAQMCKSKGSMAEEEYGSILDFADGVGLEDIDADAIINSVFSINDTFGAIVGLLALGIVLYFTRIVVVPLVIAIFAAIIIRNLDHRVSKTLNLRRLRWLSRLVTMVVLFGGVFLVFTAAASSGKEIVDKLPSYQAKLWDLFWRLDAAINTAGLGELSLTNVTEQLAQIPIAGTLSGFLGSIVTFLGNFLLVIIFTGFLVFTPPTGTGAGAGQEIADKITAYLSVKSLMSLLTAAMVLIVCLIFGIDFALFWATLAFLLNYIPSVGAIAASLPPMLLAVIQLESFSTVLLFAGTLTACHVGIGQVLEPKLMGDKLAVNPIAILLGLIFWGFLWGIPGMFLAAPLMALLRIYSSHYNFSRGLERLLAAD